MGSNSSNYSIFNICKMKVEITKAQLLAIMEATDTLSSMVGGIDMEFNNVCKHQIKLIDRFLKKNGYKREFL